MPSWSKRKNTVIADFLSRDPLAARRRGILGMAVEWFLTPFSWVWSVLCGILLRPWAVALLIAVISIVYQAVRHHRNRARVSNILWLLYVRHCKVLCTLWSWSWSENSRICLIIHSFCCPRLIQLHQWWRQLVYLWCKQLLCFHSSFAPSSWVIALCYWKLFTKNCTL